MSTPYVFEEKLNRKPKSSSSEIKTIRISKTKLLLARRRVRQNEAVWFTYTWLC